LKKLLGCHTTHTAKAGVQTDEPLLIQESFHLQQKGLTMFNDFFDLLGIKGDQRAIVRFLPVVLKPIIMFPPKWGHFIQPDVIAMKNRTDLFMFSECLPALKKH